MRETPRYTQIVIPMAGRGARFLQAGYRIPKPYLPIKSNLRMVEGVAHDCWHAFPDTKLTAFVVMDQDAYSESLPGKVVPTGRMTQGAAETVYEARYAINMDQPVVVANSDQHFRCDPKRIAAEVQAYKLDACVLTDASLDGPKWSYAQITEGGLVSGVVEKPAVRPEGSRGTIGVYWFRTGKLLVEAISEMMAKNDRTAGEFYLAPALNYVPRVGYVEVDAFVPMGTPEDYEARGRNHPDLW